MSKPLDTKVSATPMDISSELKSDVLLENNADYVIALLVMRYPPKTLPASNEM